MTTKPSAQQFRMSDGDWICDEPTCANINFARRQNCNLCGRERVFELKHSDKNKRKLGHEIGKAAAEKSKGLFSADDWQCGRCGNVNWARRQTCNMCNAPKFGDNEQRTGLGGGYNEREDIEYIEREESDSEYDDFGRRKKKSKNRDNDNDNDEDSNTDDCNKQTNSDKCDTSVSETKHFHQKSNDDRHSPLKQPQEHNDNDDEDDDDDDDDDDDNADISKYKLDDDDDEEEQEDRDEDEDSDEDLSKYDLSDFSKDKD